MLFTLGEGGWMTYTSNAERGDMQRAMMEFLEKQEKKQLTSADLRLALEWVTQHMWEDWAIDGGDWQAKMVKLGVLVEVPATEEFKEQWGDADTMFVLQWQTDDPEE